MPTQVEGVVLGTSVLAGEPRGPETKGGGGGLRGARFRQRGQHANISEREKRVLLKSAKLPRCWGVMCGV